ncbi:anti-sigma regulatory factor [Roseomonas frigidaquae]|uniref:Anti-sigma regulatory factor n=1 Tax=Falsiroseomonas frigidaquae TaxID=487318 RepID=A0ABX1F1U0_9PROT|nr:anti-sigma regulatory factor [Falsiroseomonas frigidaquae]
MAAGASSDGASLVLPIETAVSLVAVQRAVTGAAGLIGLGLVEKTKLLTASSELARNILVHAGKGEARIDTIEGLPRSGIRISFTDSGPGITDIDRAMQDGFSSSRGMGLGLPGSRRLVHEFAIDSTPGRGTRVVIAIWKR